MTQAVSSRSRPAPFPRGPERRVAVASLVDTIGTGLNYSILPIFLVRTVGLSAAQVGLAMSIAGGVGLSAGLAMGVVADRRGPRGVVVMAYLTQALAAACLPFAHGFAQVLPILCLIIFAGEGGRASRYAVIARVGADPVRFRARVQVVTNIGAATGIGLGGLLALVGSREAYTAALLGNALSFLLAGAIVRSLPFLPPVPRPAGSTQERAAGGGAGSVFTDWPYLAVTVVSALLMIQNQVMVLGLPLWIVTGHALPVWTVAATLLVNTSMVALFQVRAVRRIDSPEEAGRAWRRAGLCFLASCSLIPLAGMLPGWVALGGVLLAVVVHSLGEIWHSGGIFQIALGLAPEHAMVKYQGVFNLGEGITTTFAPSLVVALCIGRGQLGWTALGVLLLLPGLVAPPVSRWAQRTR